MVIDIVKLAHEYELTSLTELASGHLTTVFTIENYVTIYQLSLNLGIEFLTTFCHEKVDELPAAIDLLYSEKWPSTPVAIVKDLISNHFIKSDVPMVILFEAVYRWITSNNANGTEDAASIFSAISLDKITLPNLFNIVKQTGLVSDKVLLEVIGRKVETEDLSNFYPYLRNTTSSIWGGYNGGYDVNDGNQYRSNVFDLYSAQIVNYITFKGTSKAIDFDQIEVSIDNLTYTGKSIKKFEDGAKNETTIFFKTVAIRYFRLPPNSLRDTSCECSWSYEYVKKMSS